MINEFLKSMIVFDELKTKIQKKKNDPERLETDQLNAWYTNNYLEIKPYMVIPFQNSRTIVVLSAI